jgi:glycosyltransferase involved in cell wall biosynthesis
MKRDDLTAVVTHYNTPRDLLLRALASLDKFKIPYIIVDDGSDQEFVDGLRRFDDRVIYLKENMGQAFAFYAGAYAVKTKWTMKLDSDDFIIGAPIYNDGYDAHVPKIRYDAPVTHKGLMAKPYCYFSGSVIRASYACKAYSTVRRRLNDDVEAYAHLIGIGAKIATYEENWYHYSREDRKDSVSKIHSISDKKEAQNEIEKIIVDRYGEFV